MNHNSLETGYKRFMSSRLDMFLKKKIYCVFFLSGRQVFTSTRHMSFAGRIFYRKHSDQWQTTLLAVLVPTLLIAKSFRASMGIGA